MSQEDFRCFLPLDPAAEPADRGAALRRLPHSVPLTDMSPPAARLLGQWRPLYAEPFRGITADGVCAPQLFSLNPNGAPTELIVLAAERWLASLSPAQRRTVSYAIDAREWRNWNNTPHIFSETQIELRDQSATQRDAALDLLRASLGCRGFDLTLDVMRLNQVIGDLIARPGFLGLWDYALAIFGTPSRRDPWGWQLYGHHLALNCFILGEQMVMTPVFMGAEPNWIDAGDHAGLSLFEDHERQGLALMRSLDECRRSAATLYDSMRTADQPPDRYDGDDGRMVGGAFRDNRIVPYEGVCAATFAPGQRRALLDLIAEYVATLPDGPRRGRLAEAEHHLDATYFAWIGKTDERAVFYYRIHSPVVLIEFDHHKGIFLTNQDPERFHIHTVIRTPNGNDYGADLLRQHYASAPSSHGHSHGFLPTRAAPDSSRVRRPRDPAVAGAPTSSLVAPPGLRRSTRGVASPPE